MKYPVYNKIVKLFHCSIAIKRELESIRYLTLEENQAHFPYVSTYFTPGV